MDLIEATNERYPKAGKHVDGLLVRGHVPNTNSIDGYFSESETLRGIRVVPMSDFGGPRSVFYATDDFKRSERLAEEISESKEINPLIVGVDEEGPFILEGAHRFVALYYLRAKEFPALVVVDLEDGQDDMQKNPIIGTTSYTNAALLIGIGAVVGGIAYWLYTKSQAAAADAQAPISTGLDASGNPTSMTPPNAQGIGVFSNQTSPLGPAATYNPGLGSIHAGSLGDGALGSQPLP